MGNKFRDLIFVMLVSVLLLFIASNGAVPSWLHDGLTKFLLGSGAAVWAYVLLVIIRGDES